MGYLIVDNKDSTGDVLEYNTSTCVHCSAIIIYKSKPIGNFLRKVRVSIRNGVEVEEVGGGFFCTKCAGDICHWCGEAATKGQSTGPCARGA
tara:strand:- start:5613 stop:5888 length:276 start_codon:yes stop_codon:yes gene_type:complete